MKSRGDVPLIHEILPVGMLACNCSILGDEESGDAVVIDPGDEFERVRDVLMRHNLKLKYIVATHAHIDHVGGIEKLHRETGAPVLLHEKDLPLYENLAVQAAWLGVETPMRSEIGQFLEEGDRLRVGSIELDTMHTPGHSPGSISLWMPGQQARIFSGDTLFQGSIGRTDLWGGDMPQILGSIREKLFQFPDETPVFPGHGPATTVGRERKSNPFLRNF
jgi:hydroxyacylglutathione hydrolase